MDPNPPAPEGLRTRVALPGTRADRVAVFGLAVLAIILFRKAVFGGQVFFVRDIAMVWYPQVESFVRCVASGSWPLWDMYRGFGQPMLADPSAQIAYPLTWLNLLVRPWHYYTFFAVFHVVGSGCGIYVLARRWGGSRPAAFVSAALWGLSGPLLSLVSLYHHFASAAFLPWVLWTADVALASGRLAHAAACGVVAGVQILAGSADMVAITASAALAQAATFHIRWRRPWLRANRRVLQGALIAVLVALGLSAVLWWPTLELARQSIRWHLPLTNRTTWSLHPIGLVGLFCLVHWGDLPALYDGPALHDLQAPLLYSLYLGGPSVALVAAAFAGAASPRRARFLGCLALAALLIALGRYGGVYDLVVALVPALKILRFPVKWMIVVAFCWALLAGMGFDAWRRLAARDTGAAARAVAGGLGLLSLLALVGALGVARGPALAPLARTLLASAALFGAAALLAWLGIRGVLRRELAALALATLALGELVVRQEDIQPYAPRELLTHHPEVIGRLDTSDYVRLYVYDYSTTVYEGQHEGRSGWGYTLARAPAGVPKAAALLLGVQMYLNPPTAGRWGLFGSYDVDLLGLYPEPRARLVEFLRRAEGRHTHVRLLRMGGVRYALALHRDPWWDDLEPVAAVAGLFREPIQVLRVPDPLPRAHLVGGVRVADGEDALAVLDDPTFDPAREVLLVSGAPRRATDSFAGRSRITRLAPDRVSVEAELSDAGTLVLADGYDPGWQVSVDGQPAPLLRANVVFRGVALSAGRHDVEFVYRPREVVQGLLVSALTALVVLGVAVPWRRGARADAPSAPKPEP
jgi:hypothetical protein